MNKQIKANIKELDLQIGELMEELRGAQGDEYELINSRLKDLTETRCDLASSLEGAKYTREIIGSAFGLAATVLVLKHEKADVITSKAFSIATRMFRGV